MATLYTHRSENSFKTWLLMGLFLSIVVAIGWYASYMYGNPGILYIAIAFSVFMNITSYFFSDKIALAASGAKEADPKEYLELHRLLENLSITAGLPKPRLYIIEDPSPNAFATGRNAKHAAVAVTTGLLARLDRNELEGVLAHELAHVGNKDILLASVVAVLVGIIAMVADVLIRMSLHGGNNNDRNVHPLIMVIGVALLIFSPIIATIIQLAISRKREFMADATGALLTRYPEGLASALEKISDHPQALSKANKATAHMFIATPFGGDQDGDGVADKHQKTSFFTKMFMTHPPVQERIKALRGHQ
jgi:heat shock protein HtpX